jgi:hypothetical protein
MYGIFIDNFFIFIFSCVTFLVKLLSAHGVEEFVLRFGET